MSPRLHAPLRRTAGVMLFAALTLAVAACSGEKDTAASVTASPCPTPGTNAASVDALCTATPPPSGTALAAALTATATPAPTMTVSPPAATVAAMPGSMPAQGKTFKAGALTIAEVTARAAPAGERSAAYLTVTNTGSTEDALLAAASDVAGPVEVHETVMDNGLAKMQPVSRIAIAAGGTVTLKPGGYHIMLLGARRELAPEATITLTLTFERAGAVTIEARVVPYAMPAGGMAGR